MSVESENIWRMSSTSLSAPGIRGRPDASGGETTKTPSITCNDGANTRGLSNVSSVGVYDKTEIYIKVCEGSTWEYMPVA
jgi:hypothetical protein